MLTTSPGSFYTIGLRSEENASHGWEKDTHTNDQTDAQIANPGHPPT
jgi:hypothetical protein